tara:strand:- start:491 stop:730 length:240 start_codon:yes stop_codon:yes gene_type:complete
MIAWIKSRVKKMDVWDVGFTKWSTAAFILFLITIWPAAMDLVHSINPWYFFAAFIIFAIRPVYRVYIKKSDGNNTEEKI